MSKGRIAVLLMLSAFMGLIGFTNCTQVDFQKVDTESKAAGLHAEEESSNEPLISEDEIKEVVAQLPPGEIDIIRPVTDLEKDPTLFETYKCGDGGVLICHFPSSVLDMHSMCIGRSAVTTHYDHLRSYVSDGESKSIGDYLGPCRSQL